MAVQRTDLFERPRKRKSSDMMLPQRKVAPSSARRSSLKSTRFSEFSTVVVLSPRRKEESKSLWYSSEEICEFKRSTTALTDALNQTRTATAMKYIAASIEHRSTPPGVRIHDKELIRGIEHAISPEVLRHILKRRRRSIRGVVHDQTHLDQERLAQNYSRASMFAKEWTAFITNFQDT